MDSNNINKDSSSIDSVGPTEERKENSENDTSNENSYGPLKSNEESEAHISKTEQQKPTDAIAKAQNVDENSTLQEKIGSMTEPNDETPRNVVEKRVSIAEPPSEEPKNITRNNSTESELNKHGTKKKHSSQDIAKSPLETLDESDIRTQNSGTKETSKEIYDSKKEKVKRNSSSSRILSRKSSIKEAKLAETEESLSRTQSKQNRELADETKNEQRKIFSDTEGGMSKTSSTTQQFKEPEAPGNTKENSITSNTMLRKDSLPQIPSRKPSVNEVKMVEENKPLSRLPSKQRVGLANDTKNEQNKIYSDTDSDVVKMSKTSNMTERLKESEIPHNRKENSITSNTKLRNDSLPQIPSRKPSINEVKLAEANKPLSRTPSKQSASDTKNEKTKTFPDTDGDAIKIRKESTATDHLYKKEEISEKRNLASAMLDELEILMKRSSSGKTKYSKQSNVHEDDQVEDFEAPQRETSAVDTSDLLPSKKSSTRQVADKTPTQVPVREGESKRVAESLIREESVTRQIGDGTTSKPLGKGSTSALTTEGRTGRNVRTSTEQLWKVPESSGTSVKEGSSKQLIVTGGKPKKSSAESEEYVSPKERESLSKFHNVPSGFLRRDQSMSKSSRSILMKDKSTQTLSSGRFNEMDVIKDPLSKMDHKEADEFSEAVRRGRETSTQTTPDLRHRSSQFPPTKASKDKAGKLKPQALSAGTSQATASQKRSQPSDKRFASDETITKELETIRLKRLQQSELMEKRRQQMETRSAQKIDTNTQKNEDKGKQTDKKSRDTLSSDKKGKDEEIKSIASTRNQRDKKTKNRNPIGESHADLEKDLDTEQAKKNATKSKETLASKSSGNKSWLSRHESSHSNKRELSEDDKKKNSSRSKYPKLMLAPAYLGAGRSPSIVANRPQNKKTTETGRPSTLPRKSGAPAVVTGEGESSSLPPSSTKQPVLSGKQSESSQQQSPKRQSVSNSSQSPRLSVSQQAAQGKSGQSPRQSVTPQPTQGKSGQSPRQSIGSQAAQGKSGHSLKQYVTPQAAQGKSGQSPRQSIGPQTAQGKSGQSPRQSVGPQTVQGKSGQSPRQSVTPQSAPAKSGSVSALSENRRHSAGVKSTKSGSISVSSENKRHSAGAESIREATPGPPRTRPRSATSNSQTTPNDSKLPLYRRGSKSHPSSPK